MVLLHYQIGYKILEVLNVCKYDYTENGIHISLYSLFQQLQYYSNYIAVVEMYTVAL
jgi:hypothetical protein